MITSLFAQLDDLPDEYLFGGLALAGMILLIVLVGFLRIRRKAPLPPPINLTIDLVELGDGGPPPGNASLELYNVPVRLAALILAPAGRGAQLPAGMADQPAGASPRFNNAALADSIVPGLAEIIALHKPRFYKWPAQLSTQGFSNVLFTNVRLPGDRGKGTPWSVIAGRFEAGQQNVLAGVVVCADAPNSLGQFVIERPGQWLDLLRVRRQ